MQKIRVLVNGAQGKMGKITAQTVQASNEFELVAIGNRDTNLADLIKKSQAEIVIDFTNAHAVFENTQLIINANVRPIIGTSGLLPEQINLLQQQCEEKKLGGIIAPNFSIGAILMMKYAKECARYFSHTEIIELHHDEKADAPSGTAVKTAQMLAEVKDKMVPKVAEKELLEGARGASFSDIRIHSIRLPGLVAHQQIMFGATGEILTIRHDMLNREAAMSGVLLACRKVMTLNHLIYGLENII